MSNQERIPVSGTDGPLGFLASPPSDSQETVTLVLNDGRSVSIPASALRLESNGSYSLALRSSDFPGKAEETVIPVIAEELIVSKKEVPTGGVRVSKKIHQHEEVVTMSVTRDRVDIRRVIMNRDVDGPLPVRHEGNTIIVPVVEEVLVVEKRLRLKEEFHITRRTSEEQVEERVTLEREEAIVERLDAAGNATIEHPPTDGLLDPDPKIRPLRRNKVVR
jgi:uncharacterized protein (TIGR02271 family)